MQISRRTLIQWWQIVADNFNGNYAYLPCVFAVMGIWKTAVGTLFAFAASLITVALMLAVRRRRALVIQAWKRGFLHIRGEEEPVAEKKNNNQNQNNNQRNSVVNKSDQRDENSISLADLEPVSSKKWPSGAARMFEGSDIFHTDVSADELWNFCFRQEKETQEEAGGGTNNNNHSPANFIKANFNTILSDVTAFTGTVNDVFQGFCAISVFSMLMNGGTPSWDVHTYESKRTSFISPSYFSSWSHVCAGLLLVSVLLTLWKFFDLRKIRMWLFVLVFVLVLGVASRHKFSSTFISSSSSSSSTSASSVLTFPTNEEVFKYFYAAPTTQQERDQDELENHNSVFKMAKRPLANPSAILLSHLNQKTSNKTTTGKGNNNNNNDNNKIENEPQEVEEFVPVIRQFIVYIICCFFAMFSEANGIKKNPIPTIPDAELVDPFSDLKLLREDEETIRRISSSPARMEYQKQQEEKKKTQLQLQLAQQQQQSQPQVLTKDSMAAPLEDYSTVLKLRAISMFIFGLALHLIVPMMSWEFSYSSWIGVVSMKQKQELHISSSSSSSSSSLNNNENSNMVVRFFTSIFSFFTSIFFSLPISVFDGLFVYALVFCYAFWSLLFTLPGFVARLQDKNSLYRRYPYLKHALILFAALLIASADQSHMSGAMRRGQGERGAVFKNNMPTNTKTESVGGEQEEQKESGFFPTLFRTFILLPIDALLHGFWLSSLFYGSSGGGGGRILNPWALMSKTHFYFKGLKVITVPLFMFAETEETLLERLRFPQAMVSSHSSVLFDHGRAKKIGLVVFAAWSWFCYYYL